MDPQYAGIQSTMTDLRLVDHYYNLITSGLIMPVVNVTVDDPNVPGTLVVGLANGVAAATVTFHTQNNPVAPSDSPSRNQRGWLVTATDQIANEYKVDISTYVPVYPGPITRLRVMTYNQTYSEGGPPVSSASGKTNPGAPAPVGTTAGVDFPVTVEATDNYSEPELMVNIGTQVQRQFHRPRRDPDERPLCDRRRRHADESRSGLFRRADALYGDDDMVVLRPSTSTA